MGCQGSADEVFLNQQTQDDKQRFQDQKVMDQIMTLKCCTLSLNINQSPFEFFHRNYQDMKKQEQIDLQKNQLDEVALNRKFIQIHQKRGFSVQQQKINKIVQLIQLNKLTNKRYSPLFNIKAGFNQKTNQLLDTNQFQQKWTKQFNSIVIQPNINKYIMNNWRSQKDPIGSVRQIFKKFDLLCYHTLLSHVYHLDQSIQDIVEKNSSIAYEAYMKIKFNNKSFKTKQKLNKLQNFIEKLNIHVVFIQDISQALLKQIRVQIQNYRIVQHIKNSTSAILIRYEIFPILQPKYKNYTLKGLNSRYVTFGNQKTKNSKIQEDKSKNNERYIKQHIIDIFKSYNINSKENIKKQIQKQSEEIKEQSIQEEQIPSINKQNSQLNNCSKYILINQDRKIRFSDLSKMSFDFDCVIQFVGCLILISINISNQSIEGRQQVIKKNLQSMKNQLKDNFLQYFIIIGINIQKNCTQVIQNLNLLKSKQNQSKWSEFPNIQSTLHESQLQLNKKKIKRIVQKSGFYTNIGRKTFLNINKHERNKETLGIHNFLISSSPGINQAVYTCEGKKVAQIQDYVQKKYYIPDQKHPFHRFFVYSEYQIKIKGVKFIN